MELRYDDVFGPKSDSSTFVFFFLKELGSNNKRKTWEFGVYNNF